MMKNKIEILAPSGGMDSVIAAVRTGADAVYVGAKEFSARAHAENFDSDALRECVRYCHSRGVKVYLALNTVVFDDEMERALTLVKDAARADIDAVILQDMGLSTLIKKAIPGLKLHASTQMSVHTPYGAKALWELGFERVVLSRELSLEEIREIHDFVPEVELEVFVHGALCMCVSGQCYFSAMLGGRSANRGMCAQPCRLPISFAGNDHALSLKDNSAVEYLRELERIGVASAKIEGRMKRPEYVATAVAACVQQRDEGRIHQETTDRLRSVFSRSGFTDGYMRATRGKNMFGYRRKEDVLSAQPKLLQEIRNTYKDERKSVGVTMNFSAHAGEKTRLEVSDGRHTVKVSSDTVAENALHVALDADKAQQSLKKTGNTPYFAESIEYDIGQNVSVPVSVINALRREALAQLEELRGQVHDYDIRECGIDIDCEEACDTALRIAGCSAELPDQTRAYMRAGMGECGLIFFDMDTPSEKIRALHEQNIRLGVEIPRVMFGCENQIEEKLKELNQQGVCDVLAHNIGAVYMGKQLRLRVHAGFGLNITNSYALKAYADIGVQSAEVSVELDEKRIERMKKCIPIGIFAGGYLPLMISRNAPAGMENSCKNDVFLQDRKGERFLIKKHLSAYEIFNCVPIFVPQKTYGFQKGVFPMIHFFVDNSVENMEKILKNYSENREPRRFTRGLYGRGVKNFTI